MLLPIVLGASAIGALVGIIMKPMPNCVRGAMLPFGPFLAGVAGWSSSTRGATRSRLDGLGLMCIGLTGGIGSGKSTVARILVEAGAHLIDTDAIAHALTAGQAAPPCQRSAQPLVMTSSTRVAHWTAAACANVCFPSLPPANGSKPCCTR